MRDLRELGAENHLRVIVQRKQIMAKTKAFVETKLVLCSYSPCCGNWDRLDPHNPQSRHGQVHRISPSGLVVLININLKV